MDEITKNAKDIYYSEDAGKVGAKYITATIKRFKKKMDKANTATQTLMAHTYTTALQVVTRLDGLPFYEIAMGVFVYCKDETCRFISKDFEAAIELAGIDPEKFILTLHQFYNDLSAKLRKPGMLVAFAQFLHTFARLRYTKSGHNINPNIILAYSDLILHTLYYLRPNKLDYTVDVVGVSINGEPLTVPSQYSLAPLCEYRYLIAQLAGIDEPLEKVFARHGIQIPEGGIQELYRRVRIRENITASLLPLLNEYTFDVFPTNIPKAITELLLVKIDVDVNELKEKLKHRRRPLSSNGLKVEFDDSTEIFKTLILKEIVMYDQVYLLYRLITDIGDFSGYFATKSDFFYSLNELKGDEILDTIAKMVLYFYAGATLEGGYEPERFKDIARIAFFPIGAHCYNVGGKLRDVYHKTSGESGKRKSDARYSQKDILINATIRRLPEGEKASPQAIENARRLGYTLAPGETFVLPFIRRVFYLKEDELGNTDGEPGKSSGDNK